MVGEQHNRFDPVEISLSRLDPAIRAELEPYVRTSLLIAREIQEMHNSLSYRIGGEHLYMSVKYVSDACGTLTFAHTYL